ncbi:MAG: hypothetical protein JNJ54_24535 [Myxococcaceae bacterium]|nr:hypothetical protein [Myxococcaceae bacterium]
MRCLAALLVLVLSPGCGCGGGSAGPRDAGSGSGAGLGGVWPLCLFTRTCVPDAGPPRPNCSGATCMGCCDTNGLCQTGDSSFLCGSFGNACIVCPQSFACAGGLCQPLNRCDARSCSGCCALDGRCVGGLDQNACGLGGVPCSTCGGGSTCSGGQCRTRCDGRTCPGCCTGAGQCVSGFSDEACGRGGSVCGACPESLQCNSAGVCEVRSCDGCRPGQCCLGGQCVDTSTQRCAVVGLPNAACRECGPGEACGDGTELGFCVRPGQRPLGDACVWDGDCAAGTSGRPACLTGLSWPQGYCSERCDAGSCGPGAVCQQRLTGDVCLKGCATAGLGCSSPQTVCDVVDAGLTGCVPKCTASTASLLCASGRCHSDGRCCGVSGRPCCDTGLACASLGRDGGASACLADGTCS